MPITKFTRGNLLHQIGNRAVRQAVNGLQPHFSTAYDLTGQTVNNSTTMVPETNLVIDVVGNTMYYVVAILNVSIAAAANNIKLDFNAGTAVASTVIGNALFTAHNTATTLSFDIAALNTSISGGTATAWTKVWIEAYMFFTQSGNLQIDFAQVAAAATNTTITNAILFAQPLDHITESA